MGSENSKSDDEREAKKKQTKGAVGQRLYTEDEIRRALLNQKRMFEAKQLPIPTSSGIYPNLPTQDLNTVTRPTTSNPFRYSITPSAPAEEVVFPASNTNASGQTYQQNSSAQPPSPFPRATKSTSAGLSNSKPIFDRPSSVGTPHVTPSSAETSYVRSSAGPSQVTLSSVQSSSAETSYVTSSAGPSQVTLSSVQSSNIAPTPDSTSQSILTSVRLSRAARTPDSPSQSILTSVRLSRAAPTLDSPSQSILNSVQSCAAPSPGRPRDNSRGSQVRISSLRSSHVTPSYAGPSHMTQSPAGPSHFIQSSAGPSQATPTSAGPYEGNQKKRQKQRTRSRSRVNQNTRELSGTVNCVTCNGQLGLHIYQCTNGHSSCDGCRFKMARCGNCTGLITDMRNITLESTLADITISSEERIKCSNAKDGCCLHFKRDEIQNHLKECPFNIISCPVMEFSGDCSWKGTIKQLATHFNDAHPKHCEADVNEEMHMIVLELDYKVMHLVNIGFHKFLVHIRLDTSLNNIYMVTQYLGTTFGASKWTYEWHVYNKKEPRRKFEYIDVCKSNATPVSEIVDNNDCAVININYAKTFLDSGKLTFKFYIKKQFDKKKYIDTTSN